MSRRYRRTSFTAAEAAEIRRLLDQIRDARAVDQKPLRKGLRERFDFYISELGLRGGSGFTSQDFDARLADGTIRIRD